MPHRTHHLLCLIGLVLVATFGCGDNGDQPPPESDTTTAASWGDPTPETESDGDEPNTEGQGPEKPAGEEERPYVNVPQLPAGGRRTDLPAIDVAHCVSITMLEEVPAGLTATVTEIGLAPTNVIELRRGACGGPPSCRGYTFTAEGGRCVVKVVARSLHDRTKDGSDAQLTLAGHVSCSPDAREACARWIEDARTREATVGLDAPREDVSPEPDDDPHPEGSPPTPSDHSSASDD
ncbi:hypothetical protein [Cryptosporangium minutisporangium]|uniref:DUF3558 domain-containing protein n=1 Tax=Cryptosporangium minutisporangium TaxID=113569 RepID=A0ABP6SRP9_9ACTN